MIVLFVSLFILSSCKTKIPPDPVPLPFDTVWKFEVLDSEQPNEHKLRLYLG